MNKLDFSLDLGRTTVISWTCSQERVASTFRNICRAVNGLCPVSERFLLFWDLHKVGDEDEGKTESGTGI